MDRMIDSRKTGQAEPSLSKKNLIIGGSSQIGHYFSGPCEKISARNYDLKALAATQWNTIYLCFAEQRTFLANTTRSDLKKLFWKVNVETTKEIAQALQSNCARMVFFSTAELWNNTNGPAYADKPFNYHENLYTSSKEAITIEFQNKSKYPRMTIVYPFNFNSIYRKEGYLFSKVFHSIINQAPIQIGDIDYYRELLHPAMIVDCCNNHIHTGKDIVAGAGRVIQVGDFIRKLYAHFNLDFAKLVRLDANAQPSIYRNHIFYSGVYRNTYDENALFRLTTEELKTAIQDS